MVMVNSRVSGVAASLLVRVRPPGACVERDPRVLMRAVQVRVSRFRYNL